MYIENYVRFNTMPTLTSSMNSNFRPALAFVKIIIIIKKLLDYTRSERCYATDFSHQMLHSYNASCCIVVTLIIINDDLGIYANGKPKIKGLNLIV